MVNRKDYCLVPFSELLDRLTIDQIKEILISKNRRSFSEEIHKLTEDLGLVLKERRIKVTARFIRLIITLSQINLHIWYTKERMKNEPRHFTASMKLAHQLNGIRNQVKNLLMQQSGFKNSTHLKTNISTDNLKGWHVSL